MKLKEASMKICYKLRQARMEHGYSQEELAEKAGVSRQTISNWETGKTYPDLVSVLLLSELYHLSLDSLLKEDHDMLHHLEESTNVVKSNKKLIWAILANLFVFLALLLLHQVLGGNTLFLILAFSLSVMTTTFLYYEIIKRF